MHFRRHTRTKTGSLIGYLQSVGAKTGARLAIYKVWERKLELDLLFTKCGSENWSSFGYLQSVGAKTGARLLFTKCGSENANAFLCIQNCYSSLSRMNSRPASGSCFNDFYWTFAQKRGGGYRF